LKLRRAARGLLSGSLAILSFGCSAADVVNALVPRGGYTVSRDIAYGAGPRRTLDVYRPDGASDMPIIVFFYGGSWQEGSKAAYLFVGQALAARGFLTVIPDYRVYPETRFPGFLEDSAAAVRWTRDHAAAFGGNPKRLVLMGHSAGAYNAAMLALDAEWLNGQGMDPKRDIRAWVGLAGPYDFLPLRDPVLKIIFGPEDGLALTQPIRYLAPGDPPMLLLAGDADATVDPGNVTRLAAAALGLELPVETKLYPGIGHIELVGAMAWPLRFMAPVLDDATNFIRRHDAAPPTPKPGASNS